MINTTQLSKQFGDLKAVDKISLQIVDNSIFGLAGTNGAGKSTFLRMLAGVLKQDEGEIEIDGETVWENEKIKGEIFFLPDNAYFPPNVTPQQMAGYYSIYYSKFNRKRFQELCDKLELDTKRKINTFSKGMKRQVSMLLGICAGTKYLFCDETFDGLDPVMRQAAKSILAYEVTERPFTPIIASHNLRELEDICDHVGLLHKGGMLLSKDLDDMKLNIHKIQCVLSGRQQEKELEKELQVLKVQHQGSLLMITARGTRSEIMEKIQAKNPLFMEVLPLTLEEIFISETEVAGYEIKNLF